VTLFGLELPCRVREAGGGTQPGAQRDPDARPEADDEGSIRYRCSQCGHLIARAADLFAAAGHDGPRVFVNPHGLVFEVLTLRTAQGLVGIGGATSEHTWFAGYAWQAVCCLGCGVHLGWRFTAASPGASPPSFFGLIRRGLVEERDEDG